MSRSGARDVKRSQPKLAQPTRLNAALLRAWPLPPLDAALGKDARGQVLIVGGSEQIPGAVVLAALAALRAGAGRLQVATAAPVAPALAVAVPEARVIGLGLGRNGELSRGSCETLQAELRLCNALLIGPGMTDSSGAEDLFRRCLKGNSEAPIIIDAAALGVLRNVSKTRAHFRSRVIATPHAGEMATLRGISREAVLARPLELAREVARELGIILVLKGARTFVVAEDGRAFENRHGNIGLGTSGSGDVLSGIIAGLCARGAEPLQAASFGVHLHALAGDALAASIGPIGYLARELSAEIPRLLAKLSAKPRGQRRPHSRSSRE